MPSAPEGLRVVTVNTTYVELSWEAPTMIYANELGPYYVTYGIDGTNEAVYMFSVHGGHYILFYCDCFLVAYIGFIVL